MNKFTLVYTYSWMSGSHRHSLTKIARVCAATIQDVMNSEYGDQIQFIFQGHAKLEGEENLYDVYPPVTL